MSPILLLGANGQVGWELQRSLAPLGAVLACTRQQADLGDLPSLSRLLEAQRPRLIVNAAAYTAVDRAEAEPDLALRVNGEAVGLLARHAAQTGAWLVHYSTDYVFDGRSAVPYREEDPTGPLNAYGRSKLEGERLIRASGCRHLIFRTSWVYATRGGNFAKSILRLAAERESLQVVADQLGVPTSAELIADATALALLRLDAEPALAERASGIYHLQAGGQTSWYDYARYVLDAAQGLGQSFRVSSAKLLAIGAAEYPTAAQRPQYSLLDTHKLKNTFGLQLPPWQFQVDRMLQELLDD